MTNSEVKDALMDGRRVVHNGIVYDKVSAIIYRNINGKIVVSAEMLDKNENCVVTAPVAKIVGTEVAND